MDYALGAVLGACVGDAAGAILEFSKGDITNSDVQHAMRMSGGGHHHVAPGQITDDGELTISLGRGLINCGVKSHFDVEKIAIQYANWYRSNPFDVGTTTFTSIGAAIRGEANHKYKEEILDKKGYAYAMNWGAVSGEGKLSKANGSLMRCTPLGVWGRNLPRDELVEICRADSRLTHPNVVCCDSVAAYCIAIAFLINHPADNRGAFLAAKEWAVAHADQEVVGWLADAENNVSVAYHPYGGFIRIAFTHAFRHLVLGTSYADAIHETLLGGGDTDTNACIVGGLIGALHGASSIPPLMAQTVITCNTESGRPRPDFLHAKHVTSIVEQLWAATTTSKV